jgi:flagella synthesis protein FlgN
MNTNSSAHHLHACLQEELDSMTSLASILEKEQFALIEGNVAALNELSQEKSQRLAKLSDLGKKRSFHLSTLGYSSDINGMEAYLASPSTETAILDNWKQLLHISEIAKENNRANGILINRHLKKNQGALNVLQKNNTDDLLYGANGQSKNNIPSGRSIIIG